MPNDQAAMLAPFRISSFGFNSSFVIRISPFTQDQGMRHISNAQLAPRRTNRSWLTLCICICLAVLTSLVFGQTLRHGFVNYDDPRYVYQNTRITSGLNIGSITWAFSHI